MAKCRHRCPGMAQEHLAIAADADAAPLAVEQRDAQNLLEFADGFVTAGWLTCRISAARMTLFWRATSTKV